MANRFSLQRYQLVLSRADLSTGLLHIVRIMQRILHWAEAEAMWRMWTAYHDGRAILTTTHLEYAEFLAEQLEKAGLHVELSQEW